MLQDFFDSDADRTSNPCSSCLGHDAGFILHTLGLRGLHRRLLQNQSLCHSVTVHQPSVLKYLHLCHEGWMSFLVSDRHMHLHPCIAVFQSLLACVWCCIDFAMSSPISSSTCGSRAKVRYMSPAMVVIRTQKEQMTKTLKTLRKDMRKELTDIT